MIHYKIDQAKLVSEIDKESPNGIWWKKAKREFDRSIAAGAHDPNKEYWGEVKGAFMRLQNYKCVYCETPLAQGEKAKIDYDVEHHRPKSRVKPWPNSKTRKQLGITYSVSSGRGQGYPELAHHPYNYSVACKVCNSPYKSDYFPILGVPSAAGVFDLTLLNRGERTAIPLPLGDWGEDPSGFLTFHGFVAIPAGADQISKRRAEIVIDFFELNRRPDLLLGRAAAIAQIYSYLREVQLPNLAIDSVEATRWVDNAISDSAPYSAASRAFYDLFKNSPGKAKEIAKISARYIERKDPGLAAGLLPVS